MENPSIYQEIAKRCDGDIYIGVVGPVRTGKSTFIKRFMETLVIPNIDSQYRRERAIDELPQSSAGRTIMTTEPKFIPEEAVQINIEQNATLNVRMIDCVGYIVPSSLGYIENEQPRMVMTPWYDKEIPFNMAAEIGTQKVINEHCTIGLVVTTDGSISDIPRAEYEEAEERVVKELRDIGKPFVMLLNCQNPGSQYARELKERLEEKYSVPVICMSCMDMTEQDIRRILGNVLSQFPVKGISVNIPGWIVSLGKEHWLKNSVYSAIKESAEEICTIGSIGKCLQGAKKCESIEDVLVDKIDHGTGWAEVSLKLPAGLFYKILGEATGLDIQNEAQLMPCIIELASMKKEYQKVKAAIDEVNATGYGIVMPSIDELTLDEPEIVKQGGRYGVRLRASAPSIHDEGSKQKFRLCLEPKRRTTVSCGTIHKVLMTDYYRKSSVHLKDGLSFLL